MVSKIVSEFHKRLQKKQKVTYCIKCERKTEMLFSGKTYSNILQCSLR